MRILTLCGIGLLVLSCQRNEPEPLVPAAGTVREVEQAVDDVAKARCDHEQRCNRIGQNTSYSDREHCMNVLRVDAQKDLNQCQAGLDRDDLRECLTQIANEDCNGVFAGLAEYKACRLDDLCG